MITLGTRFSYEDILTHMMQMAEVYSDFVICRMIGQSHDARPIPMLRIGLGEKVLFCTAGIHGRETINPILLLKMIEEYCTYYEKQEKMEDRYPIRSMLDQYSICFIPLVNPDGYEIALNGFSAIQNPILRQEIRMKQMDAHYWKYNARGIDINRNFPCASYVRQQPWEYPASENETQALIQIFQSYDSIGYLDFHSRGKVIYYYRKAMPVRYNLHSHRLARSFQKVSHYHLGKKEEEMITNFSGGNSVQYYSEYLKLPAITIETVEDEATFPLNTAYQKETYEEIRMIPLKMLEMK
ncbi:MAG: M14 family zinc carboxypeptidase [Lachnospiraceae bacterium]|jgi:g-D-glutamyl-meso-diaminopimelate peptidase